MTRMSMVVNLDRCIGCYACEIACKQENNVPLGNYWNKVDTMGPYGDFPHVKMYFLPIACQHCNNPTCVAVCPTGASYIREDGVILVDPEICIGCEACLSACPYHVRYLDNETGAVGKCTLCEPLTSQGELPACVKCCSAYARIYGDLDDPQSEASKAIEEAGVDAIHHLPDSGNNPSVTYILHSKIADWVDPE